jgi:hypothetical protein
MTGRRWRAYSPGPSARSGRWSVPSGDDCRRLNLRRGRAMWEPIRRFPSLRSSPQLRGDDTPGLVGTRCEGSNPRTARPLRLEPTQGHVRKGITEATRNTTIGVQTPQSQPLSPPFSQQLGQLRDIDGDAARLVLGGCRSYSAASEAWDVVPDSWGLPIASRRARLTPQCHSHIMVTNSRTSSLV